MEIERNNGVIKRSSLPAALDHRDRRPRIIKEKGENFQNGEQMADDGARVERFYSCSFMSVSPYTVNGRRYRYE